MYRIIAPINDYSEKHFGIQFKNGFAEVKTKPKKEIARWFNSKKFIIMKVNDDIHTIDSEPVDNEGGEQ